MHKELFEFRICSWIHYPQENFTYDISRILWKGKVAFSLENGTLLKIKLKVYLTYLEIYFLITLIQQVVTYYFKIIIKNFFHAFWIFLFIVECTTLK
jgi:hypothetical protein